MKATLLALAVAGVSLASLPAFAASANYDFAPFTRAEINTSINATIVVGGPQSVVAEAVDPGVLEDLRIQVTGGELHAWVENDLWDFLSFRNDELHLTITVPSLDAIEANSSATVNVGGLTAKAIDITGASSATIRFVDLDVETTRINMSSSASLILDGTCQMANVRVASSATIDGGRFECVDLDLEASSSANALLFATGFVKANASSSASVDLAGSPTRVDDEINSSADVDVL